MKPREIVVVSGKGGTGKTTLTSLLAVSFGKSVICDADVDAPDLEILLEPEVLREEPFWGTKTARVDPSLCSGCGLCESSCRFKAIYISECKAVVETPFCEGCDLCRHVCPENAISLVDTRQGTFYESSTGFGPMWHARLNPGGENSGKLVQFLRKSALQTARDGAVPFILVDGPPGIACPAISALVGADLAIAVTEPSRSAFHDLERLSQITARLGIPTALVINKADLAPGVAENIKGEAAKRDWDIIGELPFKRSVVDAVAAKRIPLDELANEVQSVMENLERFMRGAAN